MTIRSSRPLVYIAGPLSSSGDRLENVKIAQKAGYEAVKAGMAPFIPHLTNAIDPDDSLGYENWLEVCLAWVPMADVIWRLPGESKGADREVALAKSYSIPIAYSLDEAIGYMKEFEEFNAKLSAGRVTSVTALAEETDLEDDCPSNGHSCSTRHSDAAPAPASAAAQ